MLSLLTSSAVQTKLKEQLRERRLAIGLTQAGLAERSGVSLPTLRKFEQKGQISLESFLKLLQILDGLEDIVEALKPKQQSEFSSIDAVLKEANKKIRKKGWRQ